MASVALPLSRLYLRVPCAEMHRIACVVCGIAGIPYEDKFGQPVYDSTESGWKNLILTRIRQVRQAAVGMCLS